MKKYYNKPKLIKHSQLKQITFSNHESTSAGISSTVDQFRMYDGYRD